MPIKDWKPGRFVTFWAGGIILAVSLLALAAGVRGGFLRFAGAQPEESRRLVANVVTFVAVGVVPLTLLTVTWRWFRSRPK